MLLLLILFYAYHLYSNGIAVSEVSYSYDKVVHNGEYWRMLTSSFSHFEIFHLAFNCMTLFQLASLEMLLGSMKYLYLSMDLVLLTMCICTLTYHVLITRFERQEMIMQQAVGYSCVLFAWIVVAALKMKEF